MRVTSNSFNNAVVDQLNRLSSKQYALQRQAATGQRIENPSDNPDATRQVLDLKTRLQTQGQYQNNISALSSQASAVYSAIQGVQHVSNRAGEIAILADGTKSPDELKTYATEVNHLIEQAVQQGNTKFGDTYLFGGTKSDKPPYVLGHDAEGRPTNPTYQGNTNSAPTEISEGVSISIAPPAANSSGSGPRGLLADDRSGADLLKHLVSLRDHLLAGDTAAISSTDRPALSRDEDNILYHVADHGALTARLEAASTAVTAQNQSVRKSISQQTDADLADTLVQLGSVQTAYQAALQSAAKLMGTSLMDYIR
ncbi:MAG: flagellin [Verrucomicrobiota bacterium]